MSVSKRDERPLNSPGFAEHVPQLSAAERRPILLREGLSGAFGGKKAKKDHSRHRTPALGDHKFYFDNQSALLPGAARIRIPAYPLILHDSKSPRG
jgi:hypothetical protein